MKHGVVVSIRVCLGAKYCPLLETEGGLALLEPIANNPNSKFRLIHQLAQQVLRRCRRFRLCAECQSTDELDNSAAAADVNDVYMSDDDTDNDLMADEDDSDDNSGLDY